MDGIFQRTGLAKVHMKEGCDTASRIHCSRLVVGDSDEAKELEPELLLVVHEGMTGVRILLYIVGNERTSQCTLQLVGCPLFPVAPTPVASNDGARCLEEG